MRLRLDGQTVAATATQTGLSAPTVSAAWKAFREGGWQAVPVRPRGRKVGQAQRLDGAAQQALCARLAEQPPAPEAAWSSEGVAEALKADGHKISPRAIDHWLEAHDLKPSPLLLEGLERHRSVTGRWYRHQAEPVLERVRRADGALWQGGVRVSQPGEALAGEPRRYQLYLHGKRGKLYSRCLAVPPRAEDYLVLFNRLLDQADGKPVVLIFRGAWFDRVQEIGGWLQEHPDFRLLPWPASS
ncbi:helix-turn-helix domain-containing protein [Halomonas sp. KAO]|uniref:helix-turn-helix domain-containing protein n=1 Tax=Halomonas sp. KAO TaxID=2783858 RepID=UPI00189D5F03|nr:helix-turn-helix domain-containing protein [Halomonas sp. KAO]MBF7052349.1 helix-turn-helix domain-containing protein [Halomonas sp. KAO]